MKLTENDHFIKDGALHTAAGKTYAECETVTLRNAGADVEALPQKLCGQKLYVLSFDASFAGSAPDAFDEAFLAALREALHLLDPAEKLVLLQPVCAENAAEDCERLSELFYHIARRTKDCNVVAGMVLPKSNESCAAETAIIDTLKKKHPEYVYYVDTDLQLEVLEGLYPGRTCRRA